MLSHHEQLLQKMKYSPSLPKNNDNVSHNHPFKEFLLLSSGLLAFFLIVYIILGFLVDVFAEKISYETETKLFHALKPHFSFTTADRENEERLQTLVDDLIVCENIPYPIKVHLIQSEEVNAIAFPGGHIAVFTGLLQAVTSEKGLAFVLAHELGHYQNRDHLRHLGRSLVLFTLSSLLTGGDSAISKLVAPSTDLGEATYSQKREQLADRKALDAIYCTYGSIEGVNEFFNHFLNDDNVLQKQFLKYFSSHPAADERIADLRAYAAQKGYIENPPKK